jgi:hypothetical protein
MRFVKDGPDVPDRLVQAHEEGQIVFFCGAGISYPAGLPGFAGLVDGLFEALGENKNSAEQAAIREKRYDLAIGLLEGRIQKPALVRSKLPDILTPKDLSKPKATESHRALLTLAKTRDGETRLVTTNFDRIFCAVEPKLRCFAAPLLPVPKKSRWDGIVYLHGLLLEDNNASALNNLVLSSGDFGLAYLTERWASRFVTELLTGYTVCFVGYSIDDPVLRYMVDALSADRIRGEAGHEVFAFGAFASRERDENEQAWRAKGVTPILYDDRNDHEMLHDTLREWSAVYRDGLNGNAPLLLRRRQVYRRPWRVMGRLAVCYGQSWTPLVNQQKPLQNSIRYHPLNGSPSLLRDALQRKTYRDRGSDRGSRLYLCTFTRLART